MEAVCSFKLPEHFSTARQRSPKKIIYLALTSSEYDAVYNSEIIPAFMEFQINYLAFMAAVQI
jgi:hypothetical protein